MDQMKPGQLAASQQVLINVCRKAERTADLDIEHIRSSVYGRFLCVRNPGPALLTARQVLDDAATGGVRLAIGITVGQLKEVQDLVGKNLVGSPINLAARLAAMPDSECRIVVVAAKRDAAGRKVVSDYEDAFDAITQNSRVADFKFDGPFRGKVKKTEFDYYRSGYSPKSYGSLPQGGQPSEFDAHIVVYDLVAFSGQGSGKQWDAVTRLTDRVAEVLHSIGGLDRAKKGQLWYAPAGDGGVLVFSAEEKGGSAAFFFAQKLADHCSPDLEIRLGVATGIVAVVKGQLPVGPGILGADKLSGFPANWGFA